MTTFFFLFIVIWWLSIFWVLPFGNQPEKEVQAGNASSAPANPRLWKKILINTIIALIITSIVMWLLQAGLIAEWLDLNERYE